MPPAPRSRLQSEPGLVFLGLAPLARWARGAMPAKEFSGGLNPQLLWECRTLEIPISCRGLNYPSMRHPNYNGGNSRAAHCSGRVARGQEACHDAGTLAAGRGALPRCAGALARRPPGQLYAYFYADQWKSAVNPRASVEAPNLYRT